MQIHFIVLNTRSKILKRRRKLNRCLCVSSDYLMPTILMTMLATRLFGPSLGYVTNLTSIVLFFFCLSFSFPFWILFLLVYCKSVTIIHGFPISQSQKKRVAEEEAASRKKGLAMRLLPAAEQDAAIASKVKFSSKFDKNKRNKRAMINAASIFPGISGSSTSDKRRLELESKRRKISATAASNLLTGGFKPSSWSQSAPVSSRRKGSSMNVRR